MNRSARLVVDASVAVKWLVEEEGSAAAETLRGADLHAPALIPLEIGNVLRTLAASGRIESGAALEAFRLFLPAPVDIHDADVATLESAMAHALDVRHLIYDCIYLALAEQLSCPLVTDGGPALRAGGRRDATRRHGQPVPAEAAAGRRRDGGLTQAP